MENNNQPHHTDISDMFFYMMKMLGDGTADRYFGGFPRTEPKENVVKHENLGDGFELRRFEILDEDGDDINDQKFSHLYKDGVKVSDVVYRKGGKCLGFRDGYCYLIKYEKVEDDKGRLGYDFGVHVIINSEGNVCLSQNNSLDNPHHYGGNLAKIGSTYYNLTTGQIVMVCDTSDKIDGKHYLFLNHRYSWDSKKLPLGVYQINKHTCEITKLDETK